MRKIFYLFFLVFYFCSLYAQSATHKVFLLAGQSNMVGNCDDNYLGSMADEDTDILIKVFGTNNYGWGPLKGGLGSISTVHGPEVTFGHEMNDALSNGDNVLLIKGAWSGTDLHVDWRPPSSGGTTGDLYNEFINGVHDALEELEYDYEIAGMCWLQGESDAFYLDYANAYQANLENFIADLRSEFNAPNMPFVISKIMEYADYTHNDIVRDAQQAVADQDFWVEIFDISGVDTSDGHYIFGACGGVGTMFAKEMLSLLGYAEDEETQSPYGGIPHPIPGIIEFEDFDEGGQSIAYFDGDLSNNGGQYRENEGVDIENCGDEDGGYNIGWVKPDEWLEYTVDVAYSANYSFVFRLASATDNNRFHLEVDGVSETEIIELPNTGEGLQTYHNYRAEVYLTEGKQILRFYIDNATGGFNLNKMIVKSLDLVWDSNAELESWTLDQSLTGTAANGILSLDITGPEPVMLSPENLDVIAATDSIIKIRMINQTEDTLGRIYFATNTKPELSEEKSVSFSINPNDSVFTEYRIAMNQNLNWKDTIVQLGFSPVSNVSEGVVEIDYMMIQGSDCKKQSIEIDDISTKTIDDDPFQLSATASSGLPVTFSIISGPASLSGDTVILFGEPGKIVIAADQPGGEGFCAADQVRKNIFVRDTDGQSDTQQNKAYADQWVATDGTNRTLPGYEDCGDYKKDKYVGMFYWLWHSYIRLKDGPQTTVKELMYENPNSPAFECNDYYWGEPENGFYHPSDPWSTRRNLQMLANAGVDFIFFDFTNGDQGCKSLEEFMSVALEMYNEGIPVPKITFFMNVNYGQSMSCVLETIYNRPEYDPLIFKWEGKPLLMGNPEKCADETDLCRDQAILDMFTWRPTWAFNAGQWNFLDDYPQDYYSHDDVPEQMPVCKALGAPIGDGAGKGSSFHDQTTPEYDKYWETDLSQYGYFFEEQWGRAHKIDPSIVCITGWNEWTAAAWPTHKDKDGLSFMGKSWDDPSWRCVNPETCLSKNPDGSHKFPHGWYFVDEFNEEFNRDIEPMKGGYTDNYYYQMISHIRQYKGMAPPQPFSEPKTMHVDGDFAEWKEVTPVFKDAPGDVVDRDFKSVKEAETYVTNTARNDVIESRVTYDEDHIYFYVKTNSDITSHTDPNWMLLFIDADRSKGTGWEGYDWIINHSPTSDSETTIKQWIGDSWVNAGTATYQVNGSEMEMCISRDDLNMKEETPEFYFKWADNPQHLDDVTCFFTDGESAPDRRFNYNFSQSDISERVQSPYKTHTVPGVIEFEDFDEGGAGVAYSDADLINQGGIYRADESVDIEEKKNGEYYISSIYPDEWLEYTVEVEGIGSYSATIHYSSGSGHNEGILKMDGKDITNVLSFPETGGPENWATLETDVKLRSGKQLLRFSVQKSAGDFCIDKIVFTEKDVVYPGNGEGLLMTLWKGKVGGREWFVDSVCSHIDPVIDHEWEDVSPGCDLDNDFWNARWEGQMKPLYTEEYTFYLTVNDKGRLWVDDQLIIDAWTGDSSGKTHQGKVSLVADEKVNIRVDFAELSGSSGIQLEWESPGNLREIVPQSQLFPLQITNIKNNQIHGVEIYPNPVNDVLYIDAGNEEIHQLLIYDVQGRLLYRNDESFTGIKSFDTKNFGKGLFMLKLEMSSAPQMHKIIIE